MSHRPAAPPHGPVSLGGRVRSFRFALRGIRSVLRTQPNAWIHAAASAAVVAAGVALQVTRLEWGLLALAMVAVWTTEILNTALEALGDAIAPRPHPLVAAAKDAAAGAVLVAAVGAVAVGALIFGPRLAALWRS